MSIGQVASEDGWLWAPRSNSFERAPAGPKRSCEGSFSRCGLTFPACRPAGKASDYACADEGHHGPRNAHERAQHVKIDQVPQGQTLFNSGQCGNSLLDSHCEQVPAWMKRWKMMHKACRIPVGGLAHIHRGTSEPDRWRTLSALKNPPSCPRDEPPCIVADPAHRGRNTRMRPRLCRPARRRDSRQRSE